MPKIKFPPYPIPSPSSLPSSPVSLADVRAALGDTEPNKTNAAAIRKIIGRGSYATIQKHLDAIRAERTPVPPVAPGAIPTAPGEAVAAIWAVAWAHAQASTLGRLEAVTVERDAAQSLAEIRAQDAAGLSAEIDARDLAAIEGVEAHMNELDEVQDSLDAANAQVEDLKAQLAAAQAEIERLGQAAVLAARDATIERQTMQAALDRQLDKFTELKAMVSHLTPATGKPTPQKLL